MVLALAACTSLAVEAASFDCAKASSRIDNAICASTKVSALDERLSEVYAAALRVRPDPDELRTAQREWLRDTRNKCQEDACLVAVYERRIEALRSLAAPGQNETQAGKSNNLDEGNQGPGKQQDPSSVPPTALAPKVALPASAPSPGPSPMINKHPQWDTRFIAIDSGYPIVVAKIADSESTWVTNVAVRCAWRGKQVEAINRREIYSPGQRVGIEGDRNWSDGSPIDSKLVHVDSQVAEEASRASTDPDVPSCMVTGFDRVNKDQVAQAMAASKGRRGSQQGLC
ncbi:lysozyme inhibitor LprI family protein [Variovorax rhizosphaerae]|uniref:Lysozyme inhibitor LprI family protein n=1 Tax=Variovorax rhizosphaerae TaxID=1836200 RepID=A0ABU8WTX1_9BURK